MLKSRHHCYTLGRCKLPLSQFKHALTQFLVLYNWGRAGLDEYTSDALRNVCDGILICLCVSAGACEDGHEGTLEGN
jgi:hypothetical protein